FEDLHEEIQVEVAVLDDEQPLRHLLSPTSSSGRSSVNVDPTPRRLSTVRSPPSPRAKRLEIASPSPVPRPARATGGAGRGNSSKIRPSSSDPIPTPVSETRILRRPSAAAARTAIEPSSVYFTALLSRLRRICLSLS